MNGATASQVGKRLSFLEIFEEYGRVEIPMIQRDYAQGRESAMGVRKRFLSSLARALGDENALNLDFIYGEVTIDTDPYMGRFEPIDGQQRLTTLFLLHWYLAARSGRLGDLQEKLLEGGECRFRFSVRPSCHRFFTRLLDFEPTDWKTVSQTITDQPWFRWAWRHDPTISGSLTMIGAMGEAFPDEPQVAAYYGKLTRKNPALITMDVLDLGSVGLGDAIYVKMNARGKELTGFEKFKAWLIGTHWEKESSRIHHHAPEPSSQDWPSRLDVEWLDLFWHFHSEKENPAEAVSRTYFSTFTSLAINIQASRGYFLPAWLDLFSDEEEESWHGLWSGDCVRQAFSYLDLFSAPSTESGTVIEALRARLDKAGIQPFTRNCLGEVFFEGSGTEDKAVVTFERRLWLHAICVALAEGFSGKEEADWFRVVRNLLENSSLSQDSFPNLVQALSRLGELAKRHDSILTVLAEDQPDQPKGLSPDQWKEECRKARLLLSERNYAVWEEIIQEAERHPVLRGQLGFLLPDSDEPTLFKKRWGTFDSLLDQGGSRVGKDEYLLARATLACSERIDLQWQERISLKDTAGNWTELLKREKFRATVRSGMVKLIAKLADEEDIEGGLRAAIANAKMDDTWMADIIHDGAILLRESDTQKVQRYYQHGIFIFCKTNWNPRDILIGEFSTLRNATIDRMSGWQDAKWRLPENTRVIIGDSGRSFYQDHWPRLVRRENDSAYCRFEYTEAVVGVAGNSKPKRIPYRDAVESSKLYEMIEEVSKQFFPLLNCIRHGNTLLPSREF